MKASDLLRAWTATRQRTEAWIALFDGDAERTLQACGAALAEPQDGEAVLDGLIDAGEYELAQLLLLDEVIVAQTPAAQLEALASRLAQAEAAVLGVLAVDLEFVTTRARELGVVIDSPAIRRAVLRRRDEGEALLKQARGALHAAEAREALALTARLEDVGRPSKMPVEDFEHWQASVRQMIDHGAFQAAKGALTRGPILDRSPQVDVPSPAWWPYDDVPITQLLRWCFNDGPSPPRFDRHLPLASDALAWAFLAALRDRHTEPPGDADPALLQRFADLLGSEVRSLVATNGRWGARIADLSAPGLHLFGRRRWPDGVPVEFDGDQGLIVPLADGALRLSFQRIVAALRDLPARRARILAELAQQFPLRDALLATPADESVGWRRHDVTLDLTPGSPPVVLVAAPGVGTTTFLRELAADVPGAALLDTPTTSLPDAPAIFFDRADQLDPSGLRTLMLEIHWARSARQPPPRIVLAGRPELRAKLRGFPLGMFSEVSLPMRSSDALREQARVTLAWVGITAARPGLYDRMAWLASGNPALLLHLCRALVDGLAARGLARRIDDELLEEAWRSDELRRAARALLWDPVVAYVGASEVLDLIVELTPSERALPREDLLWALDGRDGAWVEERTQLLVDYGLVSATADGLRPWPGGITQLVQAWRHA